MASKTGAKSAARATEKREQQRAARIKKDPAGADDFNKIPMGKAADTAATVRAKEKEQAAGKKAGKAGKPEKPAADQKKKQQRRGK